MAAEGSSPMASHSLLKQSRHELFFLASFQLSLYSSYRTESEPVKAGSALPDFQFQIVITQLQIFT